MKIRDMINFVMRKKKLDKVIINNTLGTLCQYHILPHSPCKKFVWHKHVMLLPATKTTKQMVVGTILHIQSFKEAQNFWALLGALILIAMLACCYRSTTLPCGSEIVSKLLKISPKFVKLLFKSCPKFVTKLSQICCKAVMGLFSKFSKFAQSHPDVVFKLAQNCLKSFSNMSQFRYELSLNRVIQGVSQ